MKEKNPAQSRPVYLYVTTLFPGDGNWRGGFCYDAVKALRRDGRYDVRVILVNGDRGGEYDIDGIHVWRCPVPDVGYLAYAPYLVNRKLEASFLERIREVGIDFNKIAICHVTLIEHIEYVATAMKRINPSCLVMMQFQFSGDIQFKIGRLGWMPVLSDLLYLYRRRQYEKVDALIYSSECSLKVGFDFYPNGLIEGSGKDVRAYLAFGSFMREIRPKRTLVLYNAVDYSVFNDHCRSRAGSDLSHYRIGCVANFTKQKGQMALIRAFEQVCGKMPETQLEFIGSGPDLERCRDYVREHDLVDRIVFRTEVHHTGLPDFYRSLDLFVLPTCWWEAFCCVLAEAHACGVPIIATGCGTFLHEAFSEDDRRKWILRSQDPADVAEKILRAYTERPCPQALTRDLDIDHLIPEFLDRVECLRAEI